MFSSKKSDSFLKLQSKTKQNKTQPFVKLVDDSQLPPLTDVPKASVEHLLTRKLQLCSVIYNFLESTHIKGKQVKFATLKELALYASQDGNVGTFTETIYLHIVKMVSDNIFRTFPPKEHTDFDPEYDEQAEELSWPHLKLVYDFFLHFVNSPEIDITLLRKVITRSFITQLLELFNAEDARERKCLKNMLLCIYLKFFEQREFIRKQMRNIFLRYVYEVEQFNGISELLEILSMAINGFNIPLRQEHKEFFTRALVPLHKPRYLVFYQRYLIECTKAYIRKDEELIQEAIKGILKFWPKTNTEKQVLFLQEIGELSEVISIKEFAKIHEPLMKLIASSISSLHFQVAETALNLWENQDFSRLVNNNLKTVMPIIFTGLLRVSKDHWNSGISELSGAVLRLFYEENPSLFNQYIASSKFKLKRKKQV